MKLVIAAVGRLKDGAESDLVVRYCERVRQTGRAIGLGPVEVREIPEGRQQTADLRMLDEATRLLGKCSDAEVKVALDERGQSLSSAAFAKHIADARDGGTRSMAFLIGGADGHGEAARQGADLRLALSAMTLPHGLTRVLLAEQIYRAATILAGHPYHRA